MSAPEPRPQERPARGVRRLAGEAGSALWSRLPGFAPRFPWLGGDLQTLRNRLVPVPEPGGARRAHWPIPLTAPGVGALQAAIDRPAEERRREIVLLVHGLGGCETSAYMRLAAAGFLADGHRVLRLNLRGAGPAAATSRGPYHAGLTGDLRDVFSAIAAAWPERPVLAVGFSLGGHLLLRLACESAVPNTLAAVATVSAPLDLGAAQRRFGAARNRAYERYLVASMRRDVRRWSGADRGPGCARPRGIYEFDRQIVVPAHGFASVEAYYERMSVAPRLPALSRPTLAIHADDDPWIDAQTYARAPWPQRAGLWVCLTRGGGHVGFHGRGLAQPWYITAIRLFREAVAAPGRAAAERDRAPAASGRS